LAIASPDAVGTAAENADVTASAPTRRRIDENSERAARKSAIERMLE
jgi:hypothetical protein